MIEGWQSKTTTPTARICLALARIKIADELNPPAPAASNEWTVAKACDVYLDRFASLWSSLDRDMVNSFPSDDPFHESLTR